jgi:hypothetical protein
MVRTIAVVVFLVGGAGCSRKDSAKAKEEAPSGTGSAAPAPEPKAAEPSNPQVLALDKLGLEVDAPGCAEITDLGSDSQSVTPKDPSCKLPFPGAVFVKDPRAEKSLDDDVKVMTSGTPPAEVLRKDKTATGWFVETKEGDTVTYTQRYSVGGAVITCLAQGKAGDAKADLLKAVCASARAKK